MCGTYHGASVRIYCSSERGVFFHPLRGAIDLRVTAENINGGRGGNMSRDYYCRWEKKDEKDNI